jgi:hypothetical protein
VNAFYERGVLLAGVIRKDERTKHLDELIMEGEETRLEASSPFESTKAK